MWIVGPLFSYFLHFLNWIETSSKIGPGIVLMISIHEDPDSSFLAFCTVPFGTNAKSSTSIGEYRQFSFAHLSNYGIYFGDLKRNIMAL